MQKYVRWTICFVAMMLVVGVAVAATPTDVEPPLPPELQRALTEHPESTEPSPSTGDLYFEFFKMIFMLGLLISFLLLIMWFIKRMLSTRIEQLNVSSNIKVVERRALTPKTALFILEVEDKRILVAESHNGVTLLGDLTNSGLAEFPLKS